ncbi:MAG: MMPL family transporter [Marinilabiliales bacterium]|nr:MMPL family transporter [Marinilabiliales bacterium]
MKSFIIAFIIVLLYMIFYYSRSAGLVADIAMTVNLFFMMGVLVSLNAVLTLPGIAGIVLTIGMSVDANVLIFERIKEELRGGKGVKQAIADGYKGASSAIIDSNLTTLAYRCDTLLFRNRPYQGICINTGYRYHHITLLGSAYFTTHL